MQAFRVLRHQQTHDGHPPNCQQATRKMDTGGHHVHENYAVSMIVIAVGAFSVSVGVSSGCRDVVSAAVASAFVTFCVFKAHEGCARSCSEAATSVNTRHAS